MKCPNCGYEFVTNVLRPSYLQVEQPPRYTPLASTARWARSLLFIVAAWSCVGIVSSLLQAQMVTRVAQGVQITQDEAAQNDAREGLVKFVLAALSIASAITFLCWFYKAHRNLPSLGVDDCKYTRGWVVGGFLVPIGNLWRPLQVMREVWHASDPAEKRFPTPIQMQARRQLPVSLLSWWWGMFLLSNFLYAIGEKLASGGHSSPSTLQTATWLLIAGGILCVADAIVAATVVKTVTDRQASRHHARSQRPAQLRDNAKNAPTEGHDGSEATKNCPHCGAPYRESDYRPDAPVMICSQCQEVLSRKQAGEP